MLLRVFLAILALPSVAHAACEMLQQPGRRIVELQRIVFSEPCFVDLRSRDLWFNQSELQPQAIEVTEAPLRGQIEIQGSRVFYHPNAWVHGKDSFVLDFYLRGRLQQITVVVGISPRRLPT